MKELSIEERAQRYDEAIEKLRDFYRDYDTVSRLIDVKEELANLFPELKESGDERIRKFLHHTFTVQYLAKDELGKWHGEPVSNILAWLERQGGKKAIMNVPPREVILSIWDLGNEWKELTNGSISTEHGTQLNYIQKHWQESEYYLRAKQGKRKPQRMISAEAKEEMYGKPTAWSEEDEERLKETLAIIDTVEDINKAKDGFLGAKMWLKTLKDRVGCEANCTTTWKPSEKQLKALKDACDEHWEPDGLDPLYTLYQELKKL